MWRLRQFKRRLINLFRWIPIIWKDEQWDYYHIFEILKHKLLFTAEHTRKYGYHINSNHDANRMMLCVRLIEKVQNEDYLIELINDDNLTREKIIAAERKHFKAKRILFKLLEQNIEQWWD